ncbi:ThrRS/AlaRS common domain-containing protein [Saitoella complicata NRRL Y-17804]|uniref:ThrRS/AlaRS common domain-containing protein n=1 Tax=Saitoella complicata (strain BCRC 22490 / CBS 7301 / JCM 7358 / NBRC 10748 / NRRL Y-17804) TaxID=698492 RepID=UPI000867E99A|nr:ThrRS/AlaRS common domain-containing protein [Saitoella complicata NRRL Y-17804]ODQ51934.1 ThrRS/AlaRS common domain-containing protein [Saitoella complicata NRRL Y-17804]
MSLPDITKHVGELACQKDSYLKSIVTKVVRCEKVVPAATNGKKKKGAAPESEKKDAWEVELLDTVIFPEGGGQLHDTGSLTPTIPDATAVHVSNCQRRLLSCIHTTSAPLDPSTEVRVNVDWPRRFDNMQQHSGQHLVSAVLDLPPYQLETLSWGMNATEAYVEIGRKLSEEELQALEDRCNELIREDLKVVVHTSNRVDDQGNLPADYDPEKGTVRVVCIGDLDRNPCCGTHVSKTSQLNAISILYTTPSRGLNTKINFVVGDRVRRTAKQSVGRLRKLGNKLSSQIDEITDKVDKLMDDKKDTEKREKTWRQLAARFEAEKARAALASHGKAFIHASEGGIPHLSEIAAEIGEARDTGVVLLVCGDDTNENDGGPVMVTGEESKVKELAAEVQKALPDVRGGGKARWQGKVGKWWPGDVEKLRKLVEGDAHDDNHHEAGDRDFLQAL